MSEKKLLHDIMLAATKDGGRLFRNHVGVAWHGGQVIRCTRENRVLLQAGDVLLRGARTVNCGLGVGSSDLIGWRPRVITQADVGKTVAVFAACETKAPGNTATPEQQRFLDVVQTAGGVAVLAYSVDDYLRT
jgi:hypothetical protein